MLGVDVFNLVVVIVEFGLIDIVVNDLVVCF